MRKKGYLLPLICLVLLGCDYKYGRIISSMTKRSTYEAERTYHRKSNTNVYYDSSPTRRLIFKGFDTLMVEDNGKISAVIFRIVRKKLPGTEGEESPHRIYEGRDSTHNRKSFRITLEDVKINKPRLVTSEVMDGEYNPAADSIWTYYKCLDINK
ncbi:hypothetical protein [Dyadobacter sp. 676]|uniref:Lipoprotein n=1 Tax=Dyadobacter sp. 676 TaxID=3088362 RepID=A0AAU8FJ19_9BACT